MNEHVWRAGPSDWEIAGRRKGGKMVPMTATMVVVAGLLWICRQRSSLFGTIFSRDGWRSRGAVDRRHGVGNGSGPEGQNEGQAGEDDEQPDHSRLHPLLAARAVRSSVRLGLFETLSSVMDCCKICAPPHSPSAAIIPATIISGSAEPVLERLRALELKLHAILLTHHHHDHIDGLAELMRHCAAPVYAPEDPRIPFATHRVRHGEHIALPELGLDFRVIAVPGHTMSHVAYYGGEFLFCGDTLFSLGCGRLFEGTPAQMLHSLDLLTALPAQTQVCCSHEYTLSNLSFAEAAEPDNPERDEIGRQIREKRQQSRPSLPSRLAIELACNPFLRCDQTKLWPHWSRKSQLVIQNRLQAFTALRAWKDHFRA